MQLLPVGVPTLNGDLNINHCYATQVGVDKGCYCRRKTSFIFTKRFFFFQEVTYIKIC